MKTLKIRGKTFRYEQEFDSAWEGVYTYSLYDEKGHYIASEITTFKGVLEIAKAYLTGDEENLNLTILYNCY